MKKMMNTLNVGDKGKISGINGNDILRRKLLDMGLTRGAEVEIIKVAPLGDPVEIKVREYRLSLRKEEAMGISVEVGND